MGEKNPIQLVITRTKALLFLNTAKPRDSPMKKELSKTQNCLLSVKQIHQNWKRNSFKSTAIFLNPFFSPVTMEELSKYKIWTDSLFKIPSAFRPTIFS